MFITQDWGVRITTSSEKRVLGEDGGGGWFNCDLMDYWMERLMHRSETENKGKVVFFSTHLLTQLRDAGDNDAEFMRV